MAIRQTFIIETAGSDIKVEYRLQRTAGHSPSINAIHIESAGSTMDFTFDEATDLVHCINTIISDKKAKDIAVEDKRLAETHRRTAAFPDDK